jgi:hypothetical protein
LWRVGPTRRQHPLVHTQAISRGLEPDPFGHDPLQDAVEELRLLDHREVPDARERDARIIGGRISARAWELLISMLVMEAAFGLPGLIAAPIYYAYLKDELSAQKLI